MFSTVIPFLLAMNSSDDHVIYYGKFTNTSTVYAFNKEARSFEDAMDFCTHLWMLPASIHSRDMGMRILQGFVGKKESINVVIGAYKDEGGQSLQWINGDPWLYPDQTGTIGTFCSVVHSDV